MGSAVKITEGADSSEHTLDKGTILLLRYKGVTFITQQKTADLRLVPVHRYKSGTKVFVCGLYEYILSKAPLKSIFRFDLYGAIVSIQIQHIREQRIQLSPSCLEDTHDVLVRFAFKGQDVTFQFERYRYRVEGVFRRRIIFPVIIVQMTTPGP